MIRDLPLKPLHLYVVLSFVVFLGVQTLKFLSISGPNWIFHYLNDFLLIPMVATLGLNVVWILKNDRALRLDGFTILSLVVLFSVLFEYYLPQEDERYTADVWDVVCYGMGGMVFYVLQKLDGKGSFFEK